MKLCPHQRNYASKSSRVPAVSKWMNSWNSMVPVWSWRRQQLSNAVEGRNRRDRSRHSSGMPAPHQPQRWQLPECQTSKTVKGGSRSLPGHMGSELQTTVDLNGVMLKERMTPCRLAQRADGRTGWQKPASISSVSKEPEPSSSNSRNTLCTSRQGDKLAGKLGLYWGRPEPARRMCTVL